MRHFALYFCTVSVRSIAKLCKAMQNLHAWYRMVSWLTWLPVGWVVPGRDCIARSLAPGEWPGKPGNLTDLTCCILLLICSYFLGFSPLLAATLGPVVYSWELEVDCTQASSASSSAASALSSSTGVAILATSVLLARLHGIHAYSLWLSIVEHAASCYSFLEPDWIQLDRFVLLRVEGSWGSSMFLHSKSCSAWAPRQP